MKLRVAILSGLLTSGCNLFYDTEQHSVPATRDSGRLSDITPLSDGASANDTRRAADSSVDLVSGDAASDVSSDGPTQDMAVPITTCVGTDPCTCAAGETCELNCPAGGCTNIACEEGSHCVVRCSQDDCDVRCGLNATCFVRCDDNCRTTCVGSDTCDVNCSEDCDLVCTNVDKCKQGCNRNCSFVCTESNECEDDCSHPSCS